MKTAVKKSYVVGTKVCGTSEPRVSSVGSVTEV